MRYCFSCDAGELLQPFGPESRTITVGGRSETVHDLYGIRCPVCKDGFLAPGSVERYMAVGDKLVLLARRT